MQQIIYKGITSEFSGICSATFTSLSLTWYTNLLSGRTSLIIYLPSFGVSLNS